MNRTQNLIKTLVSGITPATRSRAAPQALVLDTLCLLLDILAPKLRPVSASPKRGWLGLLRGRAPGRAQCPRPLAHR